MEGLFKNKYKPNTLRLGDWDYSLEGFYFVTICAKGRKNYFGQVKNGIIGLNVLGCVIWEEWHKTGKIRKNIRLDEFIVMPNHWHGVIEICGTNVETHCHASPSVFETHGNASLQRGNKFGPQSNNLASIIRGFKGACTNRIHRLGYGYFRWQPRFYEHIVRIDTESLEKIRYYIRYNPAYWDKDRNNPVNF